jgi:drug/metabolite transporter (DMT)-like permease
LTAERLALAVFVVLWSTGFAFVALGLPYSEPITFLALRYAFAVALLAPALLVFRPPLPREPRDWVDLVVVALLVQTAYFVLLYLALDLSGSASTVALVVSLQPILVALLAPRFAGERVMLVRWAGLALGMMGAALVIASRAGAGGDPAARPASAASTTR